MNYYFKINIFVAKNEKENYWASEDIKFISYFFYLNLQSISKYSKLFLLFKEFMFDVWVD